MTAPDPHPADRPAETPTRPPPTLRRELVAIAVLYGILSILPLALGLLMAP